VIIALTISSTLDFALQTHAHHSSMWLPCFACVFQAKNTRSITHGLSSVLTLSKGEPQGNDKTIFKQLSVSTKDHRAHTVYSLCYFFKLSKIKLHSITYILHQNLYKIFAKQYLSIECIHTFSYSILLQLYTKAMIVTTGFHNPLVDDNQ
jgi:hypothetical protein